ncbi:MAG: aldehyde dehydrogenase family protein [Proteobacteria bacterium]|nr:aldehyde dehydrogenase family protein [Pseudomonadota bacterium]
MQHFQQHYVGGRWIDSRGSQHLQLADPASGEPCATVQVGSADDAAAALRAAAGARGTLARSSRAERLQMLQAIATAFERRMPDLVDAIQQSLGAPRLLCERLQVPAGLMQLRAWTNVLQQFAFEETRGRHLLLRQPLGVCLALTSWNWPVNGPMGVLLPALAAGCPVVWKPSELASASAVLLAEAMHEAGLPAGAFNMVLGDGATTGARLVADPEVAMISFTGSGATGERIGAQAVAQGQRVVLELGGKSPFVVLPGADLAAAVNGCLLGLLRNSGQSCNAPSRLLVPAADAKQAEAIAAAVAQAVVVGPPGDAATQMGPLGNEAQYRQVQAFIERALADGARLVAGGPGRPAGLERGWYARPTVLAGLAPEAHAVQEEAFGPVLVIQTYHDIDEAVSLANRSAYGLSAYVVGPEAAAVARRLQAGMVHVNGAEMDIEMPFGGFKRSGLGRKFGPEGLQAYLETQSILMPAAA